MGNASAPAPVMPLAAVLYGREEPYRAAVDALRGAFGEPCLESAPVPFTATTYYEKEMGANLLRRFLFFAALADPADLAAWKVASNRMEKESAETFRAEASGVIRPVNLDVGYLTAAKLVLASTKDFAHRLYLRDGIYAEVTLRFRGGQWRSHEYTFPDFKSGAYDAVLSQARDRFMRAVKNRADDPEPNGVSEKLWKSLEHDRNSGPLKRLI